MERSATARPPSTTALASEALHLRSACWRRSASWAPLRPNSLVILVDLNDKIWLFIIVYGKFGTIRFSSNGRGTNEVLVRATLENSGWIMLFLHPLATGGFTARFATSSRIKNCIEWFISSSLFWPWFCRALRLEDHEIVLFRLVSLNFQVLTVSNIDCRIIWIYARKFTHVYAKPIQSQRAKAVAKSSNGTVNRQRRQETAGGWFQCLPMSSNMLHMIKGPQRSPEPVYRILASQTPSNTSSVPSRSWRRERVEVNLTHTSPTLPITWRDLAIWPWWLWVTVAGKDLWMGWFPMISQ